MNRTIRTKFLIVGGIVLLISLGAYISADVVEGDKIFSLEECLALARRNNPVLAAQACKVTAAKAQWEEKKGDYLPEITGQANYERFSDNAGPGGTDQNYSFTLQVSQPLFRGRAISSAAANAKFNWRAAGYRYETFLLELILEVKNAYYTYLKNMRVLDVAERALTLANTYLEAARERFKLGVARRADTIKAEVEVSDARLKVIKAKNALLTARGSLNKVLGFPVTESIRVKDFLEENLDCLELEPGDLFEKAEINLPELQEMVMYIRAQQAAVKIAQSEYWPSLQVGAAYYWMGPSVSSIGRTWDLGLSLDIRLFNGFSRKARVSQQHARLESLKSQKEELRRSVLLAVWVDYLKVKETWERIANSKKHLENAQESLLVSEGEYKEGVGSMLELIDARTTYIDAEVSHINVLAEYRLARAQLERWSATAPREGN
jgi:outer membrane protein